jgi:alkanesulfonate monooxygenase SsuD/methylene tetrahydromethanopterin reductase-like flavin-dependent oxidoreductase (luciferase family)
MNTTLRSKLRSKLPIQSAVDAQTATQPQPMPHREQLAVLLIGSPEGVRENIHELHQRGYAEAGDWSGLLPAPNSGEVMSVLIRYRLVSTGDR